MALVTMEQALDHLRISGDEYVNDVTLKLGQAESHVLTYLKREESDLSETEAKIAAAAVLEVLANIFFDRGDRDRPSEGPITPRIKNALAMLRDPALA